MMSKDNLKLNMYSVISLDSDKKTTKGKYIGVVLSRSHAVTRNFEIIY